MLAIELGTVLGVWAHPDDEAYLSAGLMAAAVDEGSKVTCITATRGEGGSLDEERWPSAGLGDVRERELLRSLDILGVTDHRFLGLPDIDMDTGLPEEGAVDVDAILAEVDPDTVLTFGPDGMTGHRAHRDVSRWATEAFRRSAKPEARLYYATYTSEWAEVWLERLAPFDIFRPGTPPITPLAEIETTGIRFPLSAELQARKVRAIGEHLSQVEGLMRVFGEDGLREAMSVEYFRLGERKA